MANNDKLNGQLHTGLACLPNWLERRTGITEVRVRTGKPGFLLATAQIASLSVHRAPVVQTVDSVTHRTNHHLVDSAISFRNTYPTGRDLSGGSAIQLLHNRWL